MKKILLSLLLVWVTASLTAQSWTNQYAQYGNLIVTKLASAPFPHPDRAQGHKYHEKFFSAEKNYSDNTVAIFVPRGFRRTGQVDFVVHFHGWNNHVENVLSHYQLIQQFMAAGRNAILVVPQGPYDASDSFGGKLEDENGFQRFMGDVMATLRERGVINAEPIGDILLCGHSGGYQVISSIVWRGGLSDHVKEVWLFDALYARTDKFMDWFRSHPGVRMIDLYTEHGGTKQESEALMQTLKKTNEIPFLAKTEVELKPGDLRKNRLIFIFTALPHDQVPYEHKAFEEFLKSSRLAPLMKYSSPKMAGGNG